MAFKLIERDKTETRNLFIDIEKDKILFSAFLEFAFKNLDWCVFREDLKGKKLKISFFEFMEENSFKLYHEGKYALHCGKPKKLSLPEGHYRIEILKSKKRKKNTKNITCVFVLSKK